MNRVGRVEANLGIIRRKLVEFKVDIALLRLRLETKRLFDEVDHPRWPAGTPNSRGGEFRPKDADKEPTGRLATVTRNGMTIMGGWNEGNRSMCGPMFDIDLDICLGGPIGCDDVAIRRFDACMRDMSIPKLGYGGR
jgi:hypothetical protein